MTVFNIHDPKINFNRSIAFKSEFKIDDIDKWTIKISEDFTKCILGSMSENYMLSKTNDLDGNGNFLYD